MFEHLILVGDMDEFYIILPLLIGNESQIWIALLAIFPDGEWVVQMILFKEFLGVVVAVDIDLRESIVNRRILWTSLQSTLEERQK